MACSIIRSFIYTFFVFLFICKTNVVYAVKIAAVVNDDVVTDVDVDDFEKILCKMDKNFVCGSQNSRQTALMVLVESILKLEHFKQMNLLEDKNINRGFNDYKNSVIKSINIQQANNSKMFEDYLHAEYLWNIMISAQVQEDEIKSEDIEKYKKQHNIFDKSDQEIKSLIFREKIGNTSQNMMSEIRKFYLVEIKGL